MLLVQIVYLSSETVNLFLPLALRLASTLRPFFVDMRALKPCLLTLLRLDGWYVLLLIVPVFFEGAKVESFF
jgi:hypothetical protein